MTTDISKRKKEIISDSLGLYNNIYYILYIYSADIITEGKRINAHKDFVLDVDK